MFKLINVTGALLVLGASVSASQVGEVKLNPISFTDKAPVIDGKLNEWGSATKARIAPVPPSADSMFGASGKSKFTFPANSTGSMFELMYDHKFLYLGVDWNDPSPAENGMSANNPQQWFKGGDGCALTLAGTVNAQIALWPVDGGKTLAVWVRRDGKWFVPKGAAGKASIRANRSGWALEAAIPWQALTGKEEAPHGQIFSAWEFAWSGLDLAELGRMSNEDLRVNCHTSTTALTAKPAFKLHPYLPNPESWGELKFGAGKEAVKQVISPVVADAVSLGCPAASGIVIDGKINDWKSGAFFDFALLGGLLNQRYAGKIACAYDKDFFYAVAVLNHPTGKPYNYAPASTGAGYGGGDALQIRFSDQKKFKASICAWLDSNTGKPALTVDGKAHGFVSFLDRGGELAFGQTPGGYAIELKIPWSALLIKGAKVPESGDTWRVSFQPWWRFGSNVFSYLADFNLKPEPPLMVSYNMPRDGYLSLGVFGTDGKLLQQLVKYEFRSKGAQSEPWDGRGADEKFVQPGSYMVKGIVTDEIKGVYEFTADNPGKPPWPTPDNKGDWLSDEAPPQGMTTDGNNVYVAAPGSEKGFAIMKLDANGQRLWGVREEFYPRCVCLSYLNGKVYALYSGPILTDNTKRFNGKNARGRAVLICYDAETGEKVGFSADNPLTEVANWKYREEVTPLWVLMQSHGFRPGKYIGQPRYWEYDMGETTNAIGLAVVPSRIVVAKIYDNKLEYFDPATAAKTGELALERPAGLHRLDDNTILAVSGEKVVKVELNTGRVSPVITAGLDAPVAVATDRLGNIYVSDWGRSMQVKKFDSRGKFITAIGKAGGRPWVGKWDPSGMLLPHGITVTGDNRLFVAEADMIPKRISSWNADNGKLLRDWTGPTPYGGGTVFWINPAEPDVLHASGCAYKLDWKTGKSKILRSEFRRMLEDQPFVPNGAGCLGSSVRVFKKNGKEFLAVGVRRGGHYILRREGDAYIPAAAIGGLHRFTTDDGTGETAWDSDIGRHLYKNARPEVFRGHAGDNYSWSDLNGDGQLQASEMSWQPTLTRGEMFGNGKKQPEMITQWDGAVDSQGKLYYSGFCRDKDVVYRVDPVKWTQYGPVYDIRKAEVFKVFDGKGTHIISGIYADNAGRVNIVTDVPGRRNYPDAGKLKFAAAAYSQKGDELWKIAAPTNMGETAFAASNFCGEWEIPGIGPVLCSWNWWWNYRPYFIANDGLYVGTALQDTRLGPLALWGESHKYFYQNTDGTPYLINGANQAYHFIRIDGLKNAMRFSSSVKVTAADRVRSEKAAQIKKVKAPPKPQIVMTQFAAMPKLDGKLDDWKNVPFIYLDGGSGRAAKMALGRCGDELLLAADVSDPTPMLQGGSDFRTLFTTGDVIDLMLSVDPKAGNNRRKAGVGDLRLMISELKGKPVAVLFQPVMPGVKGKQIQLMAARLDRIVKLDSAKISIVKRKNGYTVEAAVPLSELGLNPDATEMLRGDLGLVFSDAAGGRELRLYYYNKHTDMVSDLSTEATLQPNEWGPVWQPLGVNQLKDGDFETGFIKDDTQGWVLEIAKEGAEAKLDKIAFSGQKSLLIAVTTPVKFTGDALKAKAWSDFVRAANGGKGGAHVSIKQQIPLEAGRQYRVRLHVRAEDQRRENRHPGSKRGYSAAIIYVFFKDAAGKHTGTTALARLDKNSNEWVTINDMTNTNARVGSLLTPPKGTVKAIVSFKYSCCAPDIKPKLWVDRFEIALKK